MLKISFILGLCLIPLAVNAKDLTLNEAREQLLLKEVIIQGNTIVSSVGDDKKETLTDWHTVSGDQKNGFELSYSLNSYISANVRGTRGEVISVEDKSNASKTNDVFDKPIDSSIANNHNILVVVKLKDGSLIGTKNLFDFMMGRSFQLASSIDKQKVEVEKNFPLYLGKTLYKTGYTELFSPKVTLPELLDINKRKLSLDSEVKNLTPLKVIDAKYIESANSVVFKVELENGKSRLLLGDCSHYDLKNYAYSPTTLERMGISAEEKIPTKFTKKEISSIKNAEVFRGMTEDALYWSWGYPSKTNDWGRGGEQLIYNDSSYVYIKGKKIQDWQTLQ